MSWNKFFVMHPLPQMCVLTTVFAKPMLVPQAKSLSNHPITPARRECLARTTTAPFVTMACTVHLSLLLFFAKNVRTPFTKNVSANVGPYIGLFQRRLKSWFSRAKDFPEKWDRIDLCLLSCPLGYRRSLSCRSGQENAWVCQLGGSCRG